MPGEHPGPGPSEKAPDPRLPFCGDFDMTIHADGRWSYRGSPIGRMPLVKLFASVLQRREDGEYWLVTPFEEGRIKVEDAPFTAVEVDLIPQAEGQDRKWQTLRFRTNLDEIIDTGENNPLIMREDTVNPGPNPYILVRPGLEARIVRSTFYHLLEYGEEFQDPGQPDIVRFGVWSQGRFFSLGTIE